MKKNCFNCKHMTTGILFEPCCNCDNKKNDLWEEKDPKKDSDTI